jgi:hypothetical protein
MRTLIALSLALLAVAACGKDKPDNADKAATGSAAAAAGGARDAVLDAWRKAGQLPAPELKPATLAFGKDCQAGTIGGIDLVLCNYATHDEAKAAEEPALAWVGQATGAAHASGAALIVLADHKKADPNGRTMNQLLKLAPK